MLRTAALRGLSPRTATTHGEPVLRGGQPAKGEAPVKGYVRLAEASGAPAVALAADPGISNIPLRT